MSTLLLRLCAPMQSWGVTARFDRRTTENAPAKSAIIGMVACALGRRRDQPVDDLCQLRFGVRIDNPGQLMRDYQTAKSAKSAYVTNRFYLADAAFLVGLEGDPETLGDIEYAIRHPYFPLFLGRRSCPPEGRVSLGIRDVSLEEALKNEPSILTYAPKVKRAPVVPTILVDALPQERESWMSRDVPLSFNQAHRQYGFRRIVELQTENFDYFKGLEE